MGATPKNSIGIIQYVNYTRFYSICQIKMQKCELFKMIADFHIFVKPFSKFRAAGASQKMAALPINVFNYTRFCRICQLKSKKSEKIPQFLEILTQSAVGCHIKLTILLLMIHELSNFVKFFVKKILPFRFSIGKMLS